MITPTSYMARNIEVKVRIENVDSFLTKVTSIADQGPIEIFQDDTFFSCPNGRLKLRTLSDTEGQLIYYQRPDSAAPKASLYVISPTSAPATLREALTLAYGQAGRVCKHRILFVLGRTRIHLDRVEGLGHFLELEVLLADGEPGEAGVAVAYELLARLGVTPEQMIAEAYVDLLAKQFPAQP